MIYAGKQQYDDAISAYKQVIAKYPGSEESYTALDDIENCYMQTDRIREYIEYTKTLKMRINTSASREDSLSFAAAELQYASGNYQQAAHSLSNYIANYCSGGRYCALAQYYLADSYYRSNQRDKALEAYHPICSQLGHQYREEACLRCAEITYDKKDFRTALSYFIQLQDAAGSIANKQVARLGILRCYYQLNDYEQTIRIASEIIDDSKSDDELTEEAHYNRAKAYLAKHNYTLALNDLKDLSRDLSNPYGAEAKFELCNCYYHLNELDRAEQEIMDYVEKNTPYRYWLARSLVLLADVYTKRGDDFQAKQYLLSIQNNYSGNDDIKDIVAQRLQRIEERERERIDD